jgi:hypothetical protein
MSNAVEEVEAEHHLVEIVVNTKHVEVEGPKATGLQIKEAAIAQGVEIELSFQLSEKLADHKSKKIGDDDVVHLHKDEKFVAVAGDDNS